jgi:hypothetical protein
MTDEYAVALTIEEDLWEVLKKGMASEEVRAIVYSLFKTEWSSAEFGFTSMEEVCSTGTKLTV